jgi:hypothetical protein
VGEVGISRIGMIFEIIKRVNLIKVPHTAKILNGGCDGNK